MGLRAVVHLLNRYPLRLARSIQGGLPFIPQQLPHSALLSVFVLTLWAGCSGKIVIGQEGLGERCGLVVCASNQRCEDNVCVADGGGNCQGPACGVCNPLNPTGSCETGQRCAEGACATNPIFCAKNVEGTCPGEQTCDAQSGACIDIPTGESCSPERPDGVCADNDICVQGFCYDNDGTIDCSLTNLGGVCSAGEDCINGACQPANFTCSADLPTGTCAPWQECYEGQCVGPIPNDACSAQFPQGRCPSNEVCVVGTCTPIFDGNACSVTNVTGLCPAGSACNRGRCDAITPNNDCDAQTPSGLCPGGGVCTAGSCTYNPCGQGGVLCGAGEYCVDESCASFVCDAPHPNGICVDSIKVCDRGLCLDPTCDPQNLNGRCAQGLVCDGGTCQTPLCGTAVPAGRCPQEGDVCDAGVCVEGACSAQNLDGLCAGQYQTCKPGQGCEFFADNTCCNEATAAITGCSPGTCTLPLCSATVENGLCMNAGQFCDGGSCADAPCDPLFPTGFCNGDNRVCYLGTCRTGGCRDEVDPTAYCGPGFVCDVVTDTCIPPPCSVTQPDGSCPLGRVCCNQGMVDDADTTCGLGECFVPDCSLTFPGGRCPSDQLCAGGSCVTPPCSKNFVTGTCGPNFSCDAGTCILSACSVDAPLGFCAAQERCVAGTCLDYVCGADFPAGPCPIGTLCQGVGGCITPDCSSEFPGGACPANEICAGGTCVLQPCSTAYPSGKCALGFSCNAGVCEAAPCSPSAPTGPCPTGSDQVCVGGGCVDFICGDNFPDGPCTTAGEICLLSPPSTTPACAVPACSDTYPGGSCPSPEFCVDSVAGAQCVLPACSVAIPTGACPTDQTCCDAATATARGCTIGTCLRELCADAPDVGYCPSGQTCVGPACVPYECSAAVPNGPCAPLGLAGYECQNGVCVQPACSPSAPSGACTYPQVCAGGSCITPACSSAAPDGACPGAQLCCNGTRSSDRGCILGTCVAPDCATAGSAWDGAYCPTGSRCDNTNTCRPYTCANFPAAPCPIVGEVCISSVCQQPPCSLTYLGGVCPDPTSEVCVAGVCQTLACSPAVLNGACPANLVCCDIALEGTGRCTRGTCVPPDCSVSETAGYCPSGEVCCDASLVGSGFCTAEGVCQATSCSASFPFGACASVDQVCVSGVCTDLCDPSSPLGVCPGDSACVEGFCSAGCPNDEDCDGILNSDETYAACEASPSGNAGACAGVVGCAWASVGACCTYDTSSASCVTDRDQDGLPDYRDLDSDGDLIPDQVEQNADVDGDGIEDFRDVDSDGDYIGDTYEAGIAASVPVDTDRDGTPDYKDLDSDGDGISDRCEAVDVPGALCTNNQRVDVDRGCAALSTSGSCLGEGNCAWDGSVCSFIGAYDTDGDGVDDFRDTDSDADGIADTIEARLNPDDVASLVANGVDHDADDVPDYRDTDSDSDGVLDAEEDQDGDGVVDCQVDGSGVPVPDPRVAPACGDTIGYTYISGPRNGVNVTYPYDYNPGCLSATPAKCLLAETSRVHPDTDGDGVGDGQDGIFLVCSTDNLKPINVFFSQEADYAFALEQSYNTIRKLNRSGVEAGFTFDDSANVNGSFGASGFVLQRAPAAAALAASDPDLPREKILKTLAQVTADEALLDTTAGVSNVSLVINRNFISFDGYGTVVSRYDVTATNQSVGQLRDALVAALDASVAGTGSVTGPTGANFTVTIETLYRYDIVGGTPSPESVVSAVAVALTGDTNSVQSYNYRTRCSSFLSAGACGARVGCMWNATDSLCTEDGAYQIPLFFADNITNGSALTQYGDDLEALCQTLIQDNGELDFVWVIDDSGSMQEEIDQVNTAANLFVGLINNTEADYRLAQTVTYENSSTWPPIRTFDNYSGDESGRRNGALRGGFTGAIAGIVDPPNMLDRNFDADNDPATFFSSRLPSAGGRGQEFGMIMGMWAAYRSGAASDCLGADALTCGGLTGCVWNTGISACTQNYCAQALSAIECAGEVPTPRPTDICGALSDQPSCDANADCGWYGAQNLCRSLYCAQYDDENNGDWTGGLRIACRDHPACQVVNSGVDYCTDSNAPSYCQRLGARSGQAACTGDASCAWYNDPNGTMPDQCVSTVCRAFGDYDAGDINTTNCNANPGCMVIRSPGGGNDYCGDTAELPATGGGPGGLMPAGCEWNIDIAQCVPSIGVACVQYADQSACEDWVPRCLWDGAGNICEPSGLDNTVCGETDMVLCNLQAGGDCVWDNTRLACGPPMDYAFRDNATRVMVVLSDEEECYLKDGDLDGNCEWNGYGGGLPAYNDVLRTGRNNAYMRFYQGRDFTVYAIVGDKADPSQAPSATNGGCSVGGTQSAESGMGYITVAEATGGGWGSICATDLYPTIEAIIIGSIAKASPYRLEAFLGGQSVQPIASTIKVSVEVCDPLAAGCSQTIMQVVPRSRESGFDYDAVNNTLILYGAARPVPQGDIVVSYRYWVDNEQPPEGSTCPCPETSAPGCACETGLTCGAVGGVDNCVPLTDSTACDAAPGCRWNTALGECAVSGLCEPDPTCGGSCALGFSCDPNLGLCVCDVSCGNSCGLGEVCDDNVYVNNCQTLDEPACGTATDCSWDALVGACVSVTCGQCLCNTDPSGCPAGRVRDVNLASPNCGLCVCDAGCGSGCTAPLTCDDNSGCAGFSEPVCGTTAGCAWDIALGSCTSRTCGFCSPPQCGNCPAGFVCDLSSGGCVCDQSCGGACPAGTACQGDTGQPNCGQCLCDTSCGGPCGSNEACDTDTASATCGLCISTLDCSAGCNAACAYGSESSCTADVDCRWGPWLNGGAGGCHPIVCENCAPSGLCLTDPNCCGACGADNGGNPGDTCNPNTGSCVCDQTCGGGCPVGSVCDSNTANIETCGQCLCDTSCGSGCSAPGQTCDDGTRCAGLDLTSGGACETDPLCVVDVASNSCVSLTCGLCVADPTCGGACQATQCGGYTGGTACDGDTDCRWAPWANGGNGACFPIVCQQCNSATGLCQADDACCGSCGPGEFCDASAGVCLCDSTCGGSCPAGTVCDADTASASCGACVCEEDCGLARTGSACPAGTLCADPASPQCGSCIADPGCGVSGECNANCDVETQEGTCSARSECRWAPWANGGSGACFPVACSVCNPSVGLCLADSACCGGCGPTESCNAFTGECECDTSCGGGCGPGLNCDSDTASVTCGQCLCDFSCGAGCVTGQPCADPCPAGLACDDNNQCNGFDQGSCPGALGCVWDAESTQCLSVFCGLCVIDTTCGGCGTGEICNPTTGLCEPECPTCPSGEVCDPLTGACICDQTCGGVCPLGSLCDGDLGSNTCGSCVCDSSCGGACPTGLVCDQATACLGLDPSPGGVCVQTDGCSVDAGGDCTSDTCGLCVVDPTCGQTCPDGFVCDPLTGLCIPDFSCVCPVGFTCDPVNLRCVPGGG